MWRSSYSASGMGHIPLAVIVGSGFCGLKGMVSRIGWWARFASWCLCVRFDRASGSVIFTCAGRYSVVSLLMRAFVSLFIARPSGACRRTSLLDVGCWDISYFSVGIESRSALIGWVVNAVCLGYHPRDCGGGVGGAVLIYCGSGRGLLGRCHGGFSTGSGEYVVLRHPSRFPTDIELY
jgi:hypothetical protein